MLVRSSCRRVLHPSSPSCLVPTHIHSSILPRITHTHIHLRPFATHHHAYQARPPPDEHPTQTPSFWSLYGAPMAVVGVVMSVALIATRATTEEHELRTTLLPALGRSLSTLEYILDQVNKDRTDHDRLLDLREAERECGRAVDLLHTILSHLSQESYEYNHFHTMLLQILHRRASTCLQQCHLLYTHQQDGIDITSTLTSTTPHPSRHLPTRTNTCHMYYAELMHLLSTLSDSSHSHIIYSELASLRHIQHAYELERDLLYDILSHDTSYDIMIRIADSYRAQCEDENGREKMLKQQAVMWTERAWATWLQQHPEMESLLKQAHLHPTTHTPTPTPIHISTPASQIPSPSTLHDILTLLTAITSDYYDLTSYHTASMSCDVAIFILLLLHAHHMRTHTSTSRKRSRITSQPITINITSSWIQQLDEMNIPKEMNVDVEAAAIYHNSASLLWSSSSNPTLALHLAQRAVQLATRAGIMSHESHTLSTQIEQHIQEMKQQEQKHAPSENG